MNLDQLNFNRRKINLDEIPQIVQIETVMGCNLKCEMCPVPRSKEEMAGRLPKIMTPETFQNIISEIRDKPRNLHLNQMGEPLLNKHICNFVRSAKKDGHSVAFTTNGLLLTTDIAKELLASKIDRIIFSVDGFEADTYEKIRIGSNYEKVKNNILMICSMKKKLQCKTKFQIDCILSDLTKNETQKMKEFWGNQVDALNFIPLDDWGGNFDLPPNFGLEKKAPQGPKRYPCDLLWTTVNISAEGNVMYCCHDYKLESKLSNVNNKRLSQIWKEEVFKERKKHVTGKIDAPPCASCEAWLTRPEKYSFSLGNFIPTRAKNILKRLLRK